MRDPDNFYAPKRLASGCWDCLNTKLPAMNLLTVLLWGFRNSTNNPDAREFFFWEIADILWNQGDEPMFSKHRWAKRIIRSCCEERVLAVGGSASSGKSYVLAGWSIINWYCAPDETMVLLTSTDLKGARGRIWGDILNLIRVIPDAPLKIRDAIGQIVYVGEDGRMNEKAGLKLIAADKSQSKDKVGKMIGIKQKRLILVADELSDISENVINAYFGNLKNTGEIYNQIVGLSNPASKLDPFGVFCEPAGGWQKVNPETDIEWRTRFNGAFIRLDAEDSPNFDEVPPDGCDAGPFLYLPTEAKIHDYLDATGVSREEGRKTRGFMRFFKAIFFDQDGDDTFFTEAEVARAGAGQQGDVQKPTRLAGVDLSGGSNQSDKIVFTLGELGTDSFGQFSLAIKEQIAIYVDQTNKIDPPTLQIVRGIAREMRKHKIEPANLALDASGLGGAICDMLQLEINSNDFMRVQFGGRASDRYIRHDSKVQAKDRYANRASELFFALKQYFLGRQVYGLSPTVIRQLTSRGYEEKKGSRGVVLSVEPKDKFKARVGSSPDEQDSILVLVELARARFGFLPTDPVPERKNGARPVWLQMREAVKRRFDPSALGHQAHLA